MLMAKSSGIKLGGRQLLLALILVIAIYVILPQIGQFDDSWKVIKQAEFGWLSLAVLFIGGTYFAAAATYCFLSFKPLPYLQTVAVQLAAMFINRLLPAGAGAIGANFAYLRHRKHSSAQAASIVAINNTLGVLGHSALLTAAALTGASQLRVPKQDAGGSHTLIVGTLVVLAVVAVAVLISRNRQRLRGVLRDLKAQFALYARKPWRLPLGLCSSITLTSCNVMALTVCAAALGVEMSFISMLLVFSAGVAAGTVTPTPGGLGGFEAGLAAAFVASGIDGATALAVALLYRLISYWLPLAVGGVTFLVIQRQRLFSLGG